MPELVLDGLDRQFVARVRAYANARNLSMSDGARELLARGLRDVGARAAGAAIINARRTSAERSEVARGAVRARWLRSKLGLVTDIDGSTIHIDGRPYAVARDDSRRVGPGTFEVRLRLTGRRDERAGWLRFGSEAIEDLDLLRQSDRVDVGEALREALRAASQLLIDGFSLSVRLQRVGNHVAETSLLRLEPAGAMRGESD